MILSDVQKIYTQIRISERANYSISICLYRHSQNTSCAEREDSDQVSDAQADQSLFCLHMSYGTFLRDVNQFKLNDFVF